MDPTKFFNCFQIGGMDQHSLAPQPNGNVTVSLGLELVSLFIVSHRRPRCLFLHYSHSLANVGDCWPIRSARSNPPGCSTYRDLDCDDRCGVFRICLALGASARAFMPVWDSPRYNESIIPNPAISNPLNYHQAMRYFARYALLSQFIYLLIILYPPSAPTFAIH